MIKLGVLVSGGGTNLQAVIDAIEEGRLDAKISVVVSNVPGSGALERAERAGIPIRVVEHGAFESRQAFDVELVRILQEVGVDCVVLAGFMRVITSVVLDAFPMKVINIHPSLLPAFPGINAQGQALRYGARVSGCTVHFVDLGKDTGPIIAQAAVPVLAEDDETALGQRILAEEHSLLPLALQWIAEGRVRVSYPDGEQARPVVTVRDTKTARGLRA